MRKHNIYQALTLWFVILIFIQTGSDPSSGLLMRGAGMVAIALAYVIPGFVVVDLLSAYTNERATM
ncbi:hypothetical protein halTADL_0147 [Halohasta litchfieldiae]|jgi:p-aminobenzoyl-glutamate transporter AbgT|uniref:Uncharacterized protein n=1 Tax=Halohasta litchfieldiae TaxID=1073996 RepID=A0A1H6T068_9EURY|nr:hypothetical protein halTADL_0147 [Halohasta litchfieldiae]SEI71504.1 hypothetical protein SAMN05444271_10678 [Halohasta litchfieldiae]